MKDELELISALIDDECSAKEREEAILQLLHDKKAQQLWASGFISRELLQDVGSTVPSAGFAARVSQAITQEPIILVGQQRAAAPHDVQATPKNANNIIQLIFKPVAGVAVAATVAATALVVVDTDMGSVSQPVAQTQLPVQSTVPAIAKGIDYTPIRQAANVAYMPTTQGNSWKGSAGVSQELNNMLINHSQYANTGGYQSLVPYVRIVGYDEK